MQAQATSVDSEDECEGVPQTFILVDELQSCGINVSDINKLKEAKIMTVGCVLKTPQRELLQIRGITEAKVNKLQEECRKLSGARDFLTGLELLQQASSVVRITTGSNALDDILGGGVETGSITEVYGEFRSGKTQLCHTLCVTSQLALEQGGGMGKVLYIDTEGNFRASRIQEIADRFGLEASETLDNIFIRRVYTHDEQMDAAKLCQALLAEDGTFRLLIVDSIMALFRAEFLGRGQLSERQQTLSSHMRQLNMLAAEYNVAVLIANQVTANPDGMAMFGPQCKPIGGNILAHASTTRLLLKKGRGDQRIAVLQDSPSMPECDATFRISAGGICNVD